MPAVGSVPQRGQRARRSFCFGYCRSKTAYVFAATVRQHDATVARSAAAAPVQAAFSVDDGAHVVFSVFLVLDARTTVSRRIGIFLELVPAFAGL